MHATPSTPQAAERDQLARLLMRAERAVMTRRARDVAAHWIVAARLADGIALFALLLPWTFGDVITPGYLVSVHLSAILVVAIVVRQLVRTVVLASSDRRSRVALTTIEVGGIAGIGAALAGSPEVTHRIVEQGGAHIGPVLCALALIAGTVLATHAAARIHEAVTDVDLLDGLHRPTPADVADRLERALDAAGSPRKQPPPVVYGVGALLIATAGLLGPWQVLDDSFALSINRSGTIAWLGYQVPETLPLRWVLAVGPVLVVCALLRPLRRAVTPVLAAVGLGILLTATWALRGLSVGGAVGISGESTVTFLAAACCLLPVVPVVRARGSRSSGLVAVVVALVVATALLAPPPAVREAAASSPYGTQVLTFRHRWVDFDLADRTAGHFGKESDTTVTSDGGTVWALETIGDGVRMIYRLEHGRAIPVTVVRSDQWTSVDLVGVHADRALLRTFRHNPQDDRIRGAGVRRIDLRRSVVYLPPVGGAPGLTRLADFHATSEYAPGAATVTQASDGSIVVDRPMARRDLVTRYRLSRHDAFTGGAWALRNGTREKALYSRMYGSDGVAYGQAVGRRPGVLAQVDGKVDRYVLGGVTARECGINRDPLSSFVDYSSVATVDSAGDVWTIVFDQSTQDRRERFLVRTTDGQLREMPSVRGLAPGDVHAAPDGSLFITAVAGTETRMFRIADPARVARQANPLPAPSAACRAENHPRARVVGAGSQRLPGRLPAVPDAPGQVAVVVDARGTVLVATPAERSTTLSRERPGGRMEKLAVITGQAAGLVADGRGGAWWLGTTGRYIGRGYEATRQIRHVDRTGRITVVATTPLLYGRASAPVGTVDQSDGSLVWASYATKRWSRTSLDGRTVVGVCLCSDSRPLIGAGVVQDGRYRLRRMAALGPGPVLLGDSREAGGGPVSVRAAASGLRPAGRAAIQYEDGEVGYAVTRHGALLIDDGDIGRLDGGRLTLLATRESAPPIARAELSVLGDIAYWITADGHVAKVRVS